MNATATIQDVKFIKAQTCVSLLSNFLSVFDWFSLSHQYSMAIHSFSIEHFEKIMIPRKRSYLAFTIKILELVNMWTEKRGFLSLLREYYAMIIIVSSTLAIMTDFFLQFYDDQSHFTSIIESLIGGSALLSVTYVSVCFIMKKEQIKRLIDDLKIFQEYLPEKGIDEAEESARFYTKTFLFYGLVGNGLYEASPFMSFRECKGERTQQMVKLGIPCKVIVRYVLPFKYDTSPFYELVILEQVIVAILGTIVVMTISMLVCGILTHIATNLKHLKNMIKFISQIEEDKLEAHVNLCVKYHTVILQVSDKTNDAFTGMMLIHITWTSFIISVLGFGIIMETNFWNTIRFVMHLGGWLMMLFLVCFYGQILMDKSTDISEAVYDTKWYEKKPKIRRSLALILLRSQRPLVLKAAGVRIMSLSTFLGVLYSAYSYFTLLLKIKP